MYFHLSTADWFAKKFKIQDYFIIKKFKIRDYFIISSEKLKRGWTLTTSQYTITSILYFKTQRTVIENTKVT